MSSFVNVSKNGTVSIRISANEMFLGATVEGEYPPSGMAYEQFAFRPTKGVNGTLVFRSTASFNEEKIYLYRFTWDGDKIVFDNYWKGENAVHLFGLGEMGLVVQEGKTFYVTTPPEHSDGKTYRKVDPLVLTKYIDGNLTADELHRHSLKLKLAQVKEAWLEREVSELKTWVRDLQYFNDNLVQQVQEKLNQLSTLSTQLDAAKLELLNQYNLVQDKLNQLSKAEIDLTELQIAVRRIPSHFLFRWLRSVLQWLQYSDVERKALQSAWNSD